MNLYRRLLASSLVPWRMRHRLEQWVENECRENHSDIYRWLHFGRASDPVEPVTKGPNHHFFGYYDKSPWNASGRYLLAHEAAFNDRAPSADDRLVIGLVDRADKDRFLPLADTLAWNWQQGAMAQWHPADPERLFVHNDRREDKFVGVVRDTEGREQKVYERPLYALLPDGRSGFSLNFARLAVHRPGYGYAGGCDDFAADLKPENDGLWRLDLSSGKAELKISLAELAGRDPKPSMTDAWHYINHIQPSRTGKRIAFFHLWHRDAKHWEVRLYICRPDGSDLTCLLDTGFISHYDWRDDDTLLVWAKRPNASARFLLLNHANREFHTFGEDMLQEDGHCTFSPDGRWVLNDTYPDRHQMRTLMLVRADGGRRIDLARLYSPKSRWWGEIRCDLHPRWSRDGRQVCIDSVHDGTRQMYVVDVESMTR
ncbi:TolB family protein [Methylohalobius crimeensis]|uniref:TolB family protein n=1 Tax=Methylohalobius crimeensis TaxID=244365 RepID=UPI0003B78B69|nr:hypothetical protein [Methylohalobius crimeensis]